MARYLVVAHLTATSEELLNRCFQLAVDGKGESTFTIIVPATPLHDMPTWSESDTRKDADQRAAESRKAFEARGLVVADSRRGDSSPILAIDDALREDGARYDVLVLSTLPQDSSRWLRLDVHNQAEERFGLPVVHVIAEDRPPAAAAPELGPEAPPAASSAPARPVRILLPVDGSENDRKTAAQVAELFGPAEGVEVVVLHVMHRYVTGAGVPPVLAGSGLVDVSDSLAPKGEDAAPRWTPETDVETKAISTVAADLLRGSRLRVVTRAVWGNPAEVIVEEAERGNFDLIAMGSRGAGRITGLLVGSVSDRVAHRATVPVMIVR